MGRIPSWAIGIIGSLIVLGTAVLQGYRIWHLESEIAYFEAAPVEEFGEVFKGLRVA